MGFGLAGLLGLAGGAQAVGGGLNDMAQRMRADEQRRQQTALQMFLAGYNPVAAGAPGVTPTAQGHPLAAGSYAHGDVSPENDLRGGYGEQDLYGEADRQISTTPTPTEVAAPAQQGYAPTDALSSMIAPRRFDMAGVGSFEEAPATALERTLGIAEKQARLRALTNPPPPATVTEGEGVYNRATGKYDVPVPKEKKYQRVDVSVGGKEQFALQDEQGNFFDPVTRAPLTGDVKAYHQPEQSHFTTYQDTDPETGETRTMRLNTSTGEATPIGGGRQSGGLGVRGFGQGGPLGAASGLGSLKEMHTSKDYLQQFETGLLSEAPGSPTLKTFDTFRNNILQAGLHASGGGHGAIASAISTAMRTGAMEEMVRMNPQMARYARALAAWITSDLNLTRNASDERARWDQLASGVLGIPMSDMPVGDRIHYIHDVIASRNARLEGLDKAAPAVESMLENVARQGKPRQKPAVRPSIESLIQP